jgi:hypothetical protein
MRRRLRSKRLVTDGSSASVVPTGCASEAMNQIGYGLYLKLVVQSQRRPIDFVLRCQVAVCPDGICFQLQQLRKKMTCSQLQLLRKKMICFQLQLLRKKMTCSQLQLLRKKMICFQLQQLRKKMISFRIQQLRKKMKYS